MNKKIISLLVLALALAPLVSFGHTATTSTPKQERLHARLDRLTEKLSQAISRGENLLGRVESRLAKMETASSTDARVAAAKARVTEAKTAIQAAKDKLTALDLTQPLKNMKAAAKEAVASIKLAHAKIVEIIKNLKGNKNGQ